MPPCVFAYVCLCSLASSPSFSIPSAASLIYALHHFCPVYLNIPVLSKFCVRCHLWPPYDLSTLCVFLRGKAILLPTLPIPSLSEREPKDTCPECPPYAFWQQPVPRQEELVTEPWGARRTGCQTPTKPTTATINAFSWSDHNLDQLLTQSQSSVTVPEIHRSRHKNLRLKVHFLSLSSSPSPFNDVEFSALKVIVVFCCFSL